jgi:Photosynthetic reaction centre cytochrome C subunit
MQHSKKATVIAGLAVFLVIGIAASKPPDEGFKNLKVLPRNISKQTLDTVMEEFSKALGVGCDFCHVKPASDSAAWDMANDARPEKNIARAMIKMSNKINKEFFKGKTKYGQDNALLEIRCATCHHGKPHPEIEEEPKPEEKTQ